MKWHISNQFLQRQSWWFSLQRPWPEDPGVMSQVTCELLCVSFAQGSVTLEAMMSLMLYNERNIHVHILRAPYAGEDIGVWWFVEMAQMEEWVSGIACITPTVNPNVANGLWMIMMCHCRFINCNKSTIWWTSGGERAESVTSQKHGFWEDQGEPEKQGGVTESTFMGCSLIHKVLG